MPTIVVGTNSWITLAEADDYMDSKFGAANWAAATQDNRERSVISAFRKIYFNEDYDIAKTSTDEKVKAAQAETAYYILSYEEENKQRKNLQSAGVESFTVSKFSERYNKEQATFLPPEAEDLLEDFRSFDPVTTYNRELD